jgi:hypothetical protein
MRTISDIQTAYEAPSVQVIEVEVEKGFAATTEELDGYPLG